MNREHYYRLIGQYRRTMAERFDQYHNTTQLRWQMVWNAGRKRRTLNTRMTAERLRERLERYAEVLQVLPREHEARAFAVVAYENEFRVMSCLCPYHDRYIQKAHQLGMVIAPMRISNHAVYRWMERNREEDVGAALRDLGRGFISHDQSRVGHIVATGRVPKGFMERQVLCPSGGVAFLALANPEEDRYAAMEGAVTTYITEDMVQHWNQEAVEAEFPSDMRAEATSRVPPPL